MILHKEMILHIEMILHTEMIIMDLRFNTWLRKSIMICEIAIRKIRDRGRIGIMMHKNHKYIKRRIMGTLMGINTINNQNRPRKRMNKNKQHKSKKLSKFKKCHQVKMKLRMRKIFLKPKQPILNNNLSK